MVSVRLMSSALLVIALLVSVVNLFGPGALAAWGVGGGDGEPQRLAPKLLAVALAAGLLVTPVVALRALTHAAPGWWWVTLLPLAAWIVGALVVVRPTSRELVTYVAPLAVALAIPGVAIAAA